jgi:hypothetical protein
MTIALTGDQRDLAEAVAGFTARHAAVSEMRSTAMRTYQCGWCRPPRTRRT